ncbi:hypothetical protein T07_7855 [Trichinella nelsoni]|uniref:Secreted protein n=1 Tax=Trichinella nelsoni TaxID=6336 RepID=A0A0V0S2I7_9BILA|nr:hypothetical protein T07_7855 [Trichinella nelsoni]
MVKCVGFFMLILFRSFVNRTLAANVDSAGVGRNGEEHLLEWRLFRTGSYYFRQYPLKESLRNGGSTVHMTTLFHILISFVIMHHCKFSPAPSRSTKFSLRRAFLLV